MTGAVAAIVLAAGRGSRFDGPDRSKLVAEIDGRPLVRRVAEAVAATRARPIVAVTGHAADAVCAALAGVPVAVVHNEAYERGLSTSLNRGLEALPDDVAGVLVLLGDMPCVTTETCDRLIACFLAAAVAPHAVVPVHAGRRGNPVLIGRRLFPAVRTLTGDAGAGRLLDGAGCEVLSCEVDDPGVTIDVDTRDALAALGPRR